MFREQQIHAHKDGAHGAAQLACIVAGSVDADSVARYFAPFCSALCIVDERATADTDLFAPHFGIVTKNGSFRSRISLAPAQSIVAIGAQYRQEFLRKPAQNKGWWFDVTTAIIDIRNSCGFCETIVDTGGGADTVAAVDAVGSMAAAVAQPLWHFGKISMHTLHSVNISDIELKVGYEWLQHRPYHLESYVGILIPSGHETTGHFLFEPVVGYSNHPGVMFGSRSGFDLWYDEVHDLHMRMALTNHTQFLFEKEAYRSFDLKFKPWSRYMQMYANQAQAQRAALSNDPHLATPGINLLTRRLQVKPGVSNTLNTGFVLTHKKVQLEAGYNVYAKSSDTVRLATCWQEGPALKAAAGKGLTNPVRTIDGNPLTEQIQIPVDLYAQSHIRQKDLDLQSATHPSMVLQTVYASVGYTHDAVVHPLFASVGGSYTFANSETVTCCLKRWTIWGKCSIAF